ncbi:hypothetical protein O7626_11665 [Micromonospora sp. WMMD1102]|uniref:hypothetical protein n=1 Tax=Micromonospora sp. WMMD1102 TaxID=3016105 RepID=UPI002415172A|nr:hypothetical protein [Micromonospora sp. WMMD1102]MDG4786579.1 hypothetical protein [Micromonospora sp. WMMD1102]
MGSLEPGKKADVVLVKNDDSPVMFPILNPYGHVAFHAQRGDMLDNPYTYNEWDAGSAQWKRGVRRSTVDLQVASSCWSWATGAAGRVAVVPARRGRRASPEGTVH